jgi:hypothetical protein
MWSAKFFFNVLWSASQKSLGNTAVEGLLSLCKPLGGSSRLSMLTFLAKFRIYCAFANLNDLLSLIGTCVWPSSVFCSVH